MISYSDENFVINRNRYRCIPIATNDCVPMFITQSFYQVFGVFYSKANTSSQQLVGIVRQENKFSHDIFTCQVLRKSIIIDMDTEKI